MQGIPHSYFKGAAARQCTGVEFRVLGIVLDETLNQDPAREWAKISTGDIAEWAGVTEPSAIEALRNLEKKGLLIVRGAFRKDREYRSLLDRRVAQEACAS